jgi:hypothetical protein
MSTPKRKAVRRPVFDAEDRIDTREFLAITRLGKTTFFTRYRGVEYWEQRFDIRVDALTGNLHMSRRAALAFANERRGDAGRSRRAERLGKNSERRPAE